MKNKTKLIISSSAIVAALLFNYSFGIYSFNSGKSAIERKEYQKAVNSFKTAIRINPNNAEYHYYLAESLFYLSDFNNSQKEYEKTIKLDPLSDLAKQAFEGIRKTQITLTKEQLDFTNSVNSSFSGLGDNYINNVTHNGKIVHWSTEKLPLKVYFTDSSNIQGFKPNYISYVTKAFDKWMNCLSGKVNYAVVNDPSQADITISFVTKIEDQDKAEDQKESSQGLTRHLIDNNILKSVDVKLVCLNPNSTSISDQEMYAVALHEAGHALGFMGHSYDKNDIMYPISYSSNLSSFSDLSLRDISTIRYLYNLDADISNVPTFSNKATKYDKNKIILGNVDARLNKELQEAINYVNTVSSNPYGWVKLGDAYHNIKNYNKAIDSYTRALEIDSSYKPAKEGRALAYAEAGNYSAAISEYNTLISSDPGNLALSTNLALLYLQNKQKNEANRVVNSLIAANPSAKDDETIKKIMRAVKGQIKLTINMQ